MAVMSRLLTKTGEALYDASLLNMADGSLGTQQALPRGGPSCYLLQSLYTSLFLVHIIGAPLIGTKRTKRL